MTVDMQRDSKGRFIKGAGRFKPGQSGNPKGRPKKEYSLVSLLKEASERTVPKDKLNRTWAQIIVEQVLKKAKGGDAYFTKLFFEYVAGKPVQPLEIPSEIKINVNYVKRKT